MTADVTPVAELHVTAISIWRCRLELAQALLRVALAWHIARSSTPNDPRVNHSSKTVRQGTMRCQFIWRWFLKLFRFWRVGSSKAKDKLDSLTFWLNLTWLVLGGDPAVRSRRVVQFTAL